MSRGRVFLLLVCLSAPALAQPVATIDGCALFPPDNVWNAPVDRLPVDTLHSSDYVNSIGRFTGLHPDFGQGLYQGGTIGIPYGSINDNSTMVDVDFDPEAASECDPGPYPLVGAPIEGEPVADGDRHILVVRGGTCRLYETYASYPNGQGGCVNPGGWCAYSGAIFDLTSNALRPDGYTSGDAAGLPILEGLVRYDEIAAGEIRHALRFTANETRKAHVWPARHDASDLTALTYPPMGQRFRLKASVDISGFSGDAQVILRALKRYGMMLADNGGDWFLSGAPDNRFDNDTLHDDFDQIHGSDFEAVDVTSLRIAADSGASNHLFSDDFERGTTASWNAHAP